MQPLDINPKVQNLGDTVLIDLCPGISLQFSIQDSLKFLADLNRATQRAMMHVEPDAVEIDVTFDDECTTEVRV